MSPTKAEEEDKKLMCNVDPWNLRQDVTETDRGGVERGKGVS